MSVFPAIPRRWENTVFYRLRVLGAMLVSARMYNGTVAWVQIETERDVPVCRVEVKVNGALKLRSAAPGATVAPVPGSPFMFEIRGLPALSSALLYATEPSESSLAIAPLNDTPFNYYGFRGGR